MTAVAEEVKTKTVTITFKVYRYNPDVDKAPHFKEYEVPVHKGMTILDALNYIHEKLDGTLAYRWSCRMGICGSCGMIINGVPRLACQTQVLELNTKTVEVRPLSNFPVEKDLIASFVDFFHKHKSVKPYIIRPDVSDTERLDEEYIQSPQDHLVIYQFALCIKCGLCYAACPTAATDDAFLGPQALAQAYRYSRDTRDNGFDERLPVIDSSHGCWRCHYAGSCSTVCPRGLDPALAIQLLKKDIVATKLGFKPKKELSRLAPPLKEGKRRPGVPEPPPPTV